METGFLIYGKNGFGKWAIYRKTLKGAKYAMKLTGYTWVELIYGDPKPYIDMVTASF